VADSRRGGKTKTAGRKKKAYARPKLTEYGSVSKLTMAKGTTILETPTQQKKCL
jgi:hypothetical protein